VRIDEVRDMKNSLISKTGVRLLRIYAVFAYLFLYSPILILMLFSFNESHILTFPMTGFSLKWYEVLMNDYDMLQSIRNSLLVAGMVVPTCIVIGLPVALALERFHFPGKRVLERLVLMPLLVPQLITGLALLLILKQFGFKLSLFSVTLGHTVAWIPIVITQVYARLRRFGPELVEASMDLGADRFKTFFHVTLPNIKTSLIGSALLVFTLSFDEIAVTFLLTGTQNTLPMHIWSMLREGVTPEINAIATVTVLGSMILILIGMRLLNKSKNIAVR
jgi:spermidine/putrescine transport system permease protein